MADCAICEFLALVPNPATGTLGLMTREPTIVEAALDRFGANDDGDHHVVVHACPEHVVDVYRGRIEGLRMAWRLEEPGSIPSRRSSAATSASLA